jgi:hypothetical protein
MVTLSVAQVRRIISIKPKTTTEARLRACHPCCLTLESKEALSLFQG